MAVKTKKTSKKPNLELHMPTWVRALTRIDDALFWAVHDCLRSCEDVTDRELKVKAFARTYRTATALLDRVRAGVARGKRVVDRLDALGLKLDTLRPAEELEACPHCYTGVTKEALQRAAERRIKEHKPTGCIACAVWERRPYRLEVSWKQARAFLAVIDAHTDAALDAVPDRTMVDVLDDEIAAELFAREAKRLRAGGALPRFTWGAEALKKGAKPFTVTTGEPSPKRARTRPASGPATFPPNTARGPRVGIER